MNEIEKIIQEAQAKIDEQFPGLQVTVIETDDICRRCWLASQKFVTSLSSAQPTQKELTVVL